MQQTDGAACAFYTEIVKATELQKQKTEPLCLAFKWCWMAGPSNEIKKHKSHYALKTKLLDN